MRRKARVVAKGYSQRPGVDFKEIFAPVVRLGSVRLLLALAVENDLIVHQLDVTTAFLNGDIGEEEIYMEVLELFEEMLPEIIFKDDLKNAEINLQKTVSKMLERIQTGNQVCLMKKALYGLKQAGRQWYVKLDRELRNLGLEPLNADACIYIRKSATEILIIAIYVDDMLLFSNTSKSLSDFKRKFGERFQVKDLGKVKHCLGMEFRQEKDFLEISQTAYIEEVLKKFGMQNSKPAVTPMDLGTKLKKVEESSEEDSSYPFREFIGSLMYLSVATRPDITYAVNYLSQFNNSNGREHWTAAKRILRYLRGTSKLGLKYKKTPKRLEGFVDADWAGCLEDRRSYIGFVFLLALGAVSWEAKKQRIVALSSTEAEYMALTEAAKEAVHLQRFLKEIGLKEQIIVPI